MYCIIHSILFIVFQVSGGLTNQTDDVSICKVSPMGFKNSKVPSSHLLLKLSPGGPVVIILVTGSEVCGFKPS